MNNSRDWFNLLVLLLKLKLFCTESSCNSQDSSNTGTSMSSPVFTKPEKTSPVFSKPTPSPVVTKKKRPMRLDSESDEEPIKSPVKDPDRDTGQWLSKETAMNGHITGGSSKNKPPSTGSRQAKSTSKYVTLRVKINSKMIIFITRKRFQKNQ